MIETPHRSIALTFFILLFTFGKSFAQPNSFSYFTWDDRSEWKAAVVKIFKPGDSMPQVRFLHSRETPKGLEETHYDDHINYISDAGENWQATIQYNPGAGTFYFTHCKDGGEECHDDVIMNYRHISGENRQLTIENNSLRRFQSKSKQINVNSKFLNRWDGAGTGGNVFKEGVYINWKAGEHCGCSSNGGGCKHYLQNATGSKYKVTVQSTTNATPSHINTHDYVIEPGGEIFIGCSQAQSQGCFSVDFAILNQCKQ